MLTQVGLKRVKKAVIKLANEQDDELNEILQATVVQLNRLIAQRLEG